MFYCEPALEGADEQRLRDELHPSAGSRSTRSALRRVDIVGNIMELASMATVVEAEQDPLPKKRERATLPLHRPYCEVVF